MVKSKATAGNQLFPDTGWNPQRRVRVNLSFSAREIEVLDLLAGAEELKRSTYLRRIILRSTKVKMEAGVQRRIDAQAAVGYVPPHEADRRWGKLGRKDRAETSMFDQLAAMVPHGQDRVPYYKTREARALLQALPPGLSASAEQLMMKMRRQPTLAEYAAAGINLKAI